MIAFEYWGRRLKWALTCLTFFALPFLLVLYGLNARWTIQETQSIAKAYEGLDRLLLRMRRREDTLDYLFDLLSALTRVAGSGPDRFSRLQRGMRTLRARFPGVLRFTVCDGQGQVIPALSDGHPPRAVVKKFFDLVTEDVPRSVLRERFQKTLNIYKAFVGNDVNPQFIEQRRHSFVKASSLETDRYFGYICEPGQFGLLVHASEPPGMMLAGLADQAAQLMRYRSHLGVEVGVHDMAAVATPTGLLAIALGHFQSTNRPHVQVGDRLFSIMPLLTTGRFWASRPRSVALDFSRHRRWLIGIGLAIFAILALFSHSVMVGGRPFPISIRWRLVVLFAFASGLPLAVVILAGWDYLNQKYATRVRQTHDEMERTLQAFDAQFPLMRGRMEITFTRIFRTCRFDTERARARAIRVMKWFCARFFASDLVLFDERGNVAWDAEPEVGFKGHRGRKMMGSIAGEILANLNREVFKGKTDAAIMFLESFTGGENPVSQITRNLGKIFEFSTSGASTWTYVNPLISRERRFTHMVMANWRKQELEKLYLKRELVNSRKGLPGGYLISFNDKFREWMPSDFKYRDRVESFLRDVLLRQATTIGRVRLPSGRFLLTGIKPKELTGQVLIAMVPERPIEDEIRGLERQLWVFSCLSAGISLFLGFLLSQRFLTPISELSAGVEAIQKRQFQHRVPPGEPDELGELAATFNRVMEGLSDLEVGRIVQESLFPTQEVRGGPFRVYGMTSSATELGGDYYDLQTLPDGRLLVLIGDVSGHGVPAALVMAMAKALVERECEIDATPDVLLSNVHRVFYRTLKRRRMMTCFLGLLDPRTGVLSYANAGHNFPYLFRAGAAPRFFESKALPLGSMKKNQFELQQEPMQTGDRVLLYTDGLVEAKARNGEAIGYNGMLAGVTPLLDDDPKASCERILAWHRQVTGGGPQEDDITIVLITCGVVPEGAASA